MNNGQTTVFITGGTGFLGSALINKLVSRSVNVICYGRSLSKIREKFGDSVCATNNFDHANIDYVIHAACPTASKTLKEQPVEVIDSIYSLTKQSLELAKSARARYIFLSSMEIYDNLNGYVNETQTGHFSLDNVRNAYPVTKQLAELLVNSYHREYGVVTCVVRLAQLFGPGCQFDDNRFFVFAMRKCLMGEPIILNTDGTKWHNSCYINDAVNLICKILMSKATGTFNISNEDYCMSINELCRKIISITASDIELRHELLDDTVFRPDSKYKMSSEKIQNMFPDYKMTPFEQAIKETYNYLKSFR